MDLSSVLSKTAKGLDEIATRRHRLPARMRALLIMVDGRHSGKQLLAMRPSTVEAERHLAALLAEGFIQSRASPATRQQPLPDEDITLAKSYIVRTLRELLGVEADALIREIEMLTNADQLQRHVEKMRVALSAVADQKKAQQFLDELALVLD
ncbi:hypothetical protein [Accumulibacter sp.]|uniref:hypothetical protein n=1 Tax=Accumulibacter sp. TaxID=2053492 RepID=UPI00261F9A10|nr:hypothetical protein [Accumulibacter sp.]